MKKSLLFFLCLALVASIGTVTVCYGKDVGNSPPKIEIIKDVVIASEVSFTNVQYQSVVTYPAYDQGNEAHVSDNDIGLTEENVKLPDKIVKPERWKDLHRRTGISYTDTYKNKVIKVTDEGKDTHRRLCV